MKTLRSWASQDSRLRPRDYEFPALTAELHPNIIEEFDAIAKRLALPD